MFFFITQWLLSRTSIIPICWCAGDVYVYVYTPRVHWFVHVHYYTIGLKPSCQS
jgi:hypothetical protein